MYATNMQVFRFSNQPGRYRQKTIPGGSIEFKIVVHIGRVLCTTALNPMHLVWIFFLNPALLVSPEGVSG